MPRKKIVKEKDEKTSSSVDELLANRTENDHVIMQLNLSDDSIYSITNNLKDSIHREPQAYDPNSFSHDSEIIQDNIDTHRTSVCFWCCHDLVDFSCGMPIKYNKIKDHFEIYGTFCSFQCVSAYNFSINSKSYKVWEINSYINMLANRYGYKDTIKPAPDRYVLKMFGGEMTIDEFRMIHKEKDRSLVLNIPPMTNVSSSTELLNTSYMNKETKSKNSIQNKMMCI
jgi:hypothetical protein